MAIKPDIYVKGADYNINTMDQTERSILEEVGADIRFFVIYRRVFFNKYYK